MKAFPPKERSGVYRAISSFRPVRAFRPEPVPDGILERVLRAAVRCPLGGGVPWRFLLVRDERLRRTVTAALEGKGGAPAGREPASAPGASPLAISPVHLCVLCESLPSRRDTALRDLFQVCGAIHGLCLAARAEGIGVAFVAIGRSEEVRRALGIPRTFHPLAYLCLGYPAPDPGAASAPGGGPGTFSEVIGAPREGVEGLRGLGASEGPA